MFNPKAVYTLLQELDDGMVLEIQNSRCHHIIKREGMGIEVKNAGGGYASDADKACTLEALLTKPKVFKRYKERMTLKEAAEKYKYFRTTERNSFIYTLDDQNNIVLHDDCNAAHLNLEDIQREYWYGSDNAAEL